MVFYFSATGNSLYVAKQLDLEAISIPQAIHQAELTFQSDMIGVVCPVYGHEMPDMVKDFLRKATFRTEYFYLILTYGRIHGGAAELAEEFLKGCGKQADYIQSILMVDNFLPSFDMEEEIAIAPEKKVEEQLAAIKTDIASYKRWKQPVTQEDRDWHLKYLEHHNSVPADFWKHFYYVTDSCIGCGICTRVCPVGCIRLEQGKAVHTMENCQMCMACTHHCPQTAIQLNMPEKNPKARYRNEHISLAEIIAANEQTR